MRGKNRFVKTLILAPKMYPVARIPLKMVEDDVYLVRNFEHEIHMIFQDEWKKLKSNTECVEKIGLFKL